MDSSLYQELGENQFRLLKIVNQDPRQWAFSVFSLGDVPHYAALSYVWGDPKLTQHIILEGQQFKVTKNLSPALDGALDSWIKAFPKRDIKNFSIWVDAVCINQEDRDERQKQVLLMENIYSSAELVISWLGEADSKVYLAMDTFLSLQELTDINLNIASDTYGDNEWAAIQALMGLEYWRRIWILQEIFLAKSLLLVCGDRALEWRTVDNVVRKMSKLRTTIKEYALQQPRNISKSTWHTISTPEWPVDWTRMDCLVSYKKRRNDEWRENDPSLKWEFCAYILHHLEATDNKDYVYGIPGMAGIKHDYSERTSASDVYLELVGAWESEWNTRVIKSPPELFFLAFSGLSLNLEIPNLPSWAPARSPYNGRVRKSRVLSGVGEPAMYELFPHNTPNFKIDGPSLYLSVFEVTHVTSITELSDQDPLLITITNFLIDSSAITSFGATFKLLCYRLTRTDTLDVAGFELALAFFKKLLGAIEESDDKKREIFLQCVGICLKSAQDFNDSFKAALGPIDAGTEGDRIFEASNVFHSRWKSSAVTEDDVTENDQIITAELERSQGMSLFRTGSGHVGIAVIGVKREDTICVLKGSPFLSLLRRTKDRKYNHVGTCTVFGLMEGMVEWLTEDIVQIKMI